jgi:predicted Zn-dependent protease with MMP-like domain
MYHMTREDFSTEVAEALDSLPKEFRRRIQNVAVLVEDLPPDPIPAQAGQPRRVLLGLFHGVPLTKKSVFHGPIGSPDYVFFTRRTLRRSALPRPRCANKSDEQSFTKWAITSG